MENIIVEEGECNRESAGIQLPNYVIFEEWYGVVRVLL